MLASRQALGIDICDDACRVVGLRRAGRGYALTFAGYLPLTGEDDAEPLAGLLREAGAGPSVIAAALPASACAFKTASLPPGKPAVLAQVVRFEAENQFPLPLHEFEWGYQLTPDPQGRRHAVIAGARKAQVAERMAQLREADLTPTLLLPAPLAAAQAAGLPVGRHAVVVAGTEWTDLCLYEDDRLLACRSVLAGAADAQGWSDRIAREIRPWLAGHEELREIRLLGDAGEATAAALHRSCGLEVRLVSPWQDIRDPRAFLHELDGHPAAYAVAIGLAQAALAGGEMNLLPRPLLEARRQGRTLAWTLAGLLVLLGALVPPTLSAMRQAADRQAALAELRAEVREARHAIAAPPAPGLVPAHGVLTTLARPESQPLEVLSLVSAHLPQGITLTTLDYQRERTVVIKGRAADNAVLGKAVSVMNRLPVFETVTLDYANLAKDEVDPGYDFQMTGVLPEGQDVTLHTGARGTRNRRVVR